MARSLGHADRALRVKRLWWRGRLELECSGPRREPGGSRRSAANTATLTRMFRQVGSRHVTWRSLHVASLEQSYFGGLSMRHLRLCLAAGRKAMDVNIRCRRASSNRLAEPRIQQRLHGPYA